MSVEIIIHSIYNFTVKRIFLKIFIILLLPSYSFACALLNVPIGSSIPSVVGTFEFLDGHDTQYKGSGRSFRYIEPAMDYCEGASLENADLEIIIYDHKIASISLFSTDTESQNEIYEFAKVRISDPGEEVKKKNWTGFKNLSVGSLLIFYS